MSRYNLEFKFDIEEHVPILVQARGDDVKSLIADAEYSVDLPDPKKFYAIDNLSVAGYHAVIGAIEEEVRHREGMRSER